MPYRLLIALALLLVPVAAQSEEVRSSVSLGVQVTKPDGWVDASPADFARTFEQMKTDDPQFQAMVAANANLPLFAFLKYKEPYEDINPSFKLTIRPLGAAKGIAPEKLVELSTKPLAKMFGDLTFVTPPRATTLAGLPAGHTKLSYTLRAGDFAGRVTSEMWMVPRDHYVAIIGAAYREDEKTGSASEVLKVVESITFK